MIRTKPPRIYVPAVHLQGCTWVLFQLLLLPERPRMALELPFASPPGGVKTQGSSWKKRSSNGTNHTSQGGRDFRFLGREKVGKRFGKVDKVDPGSRPQWDESKRRKKHTSDFTSYTYEFM